MDNLRLRLLPINSERFRREKRKIAISRPDALKSSRELLSPGPKVRLPRHPGKEVTAAVSGEAKNSARATSGPAYAHVITTTDELIADLSGYQKAALIA
jgi:hypothetical protein